MLAPIFSFQIGKSPPLLGLAIWLAILLALFARPTDWNIAPVAAKGPLFLIALGAANHVRRQLDHVIESRKCIREHPRCPWRCSCRQLGAKLMESATGRRRLVFEQPISERADVGYSALGSPACAVKQLQGGVLCYGILVDRAQQSVDLPDRDLQD
jgi:hypothetical protein